MMEDLGVEVDFGVHGSPEESHEVHAVDVEADLLVGRGDGLVLLEVVALGDQTDPDESVHAGTLSPCCSVDRGGDPRVVELLDRDVQCLLALIDEVDNDVLEVIGSACGSRWTEKRLQTAIEKVHESPPPLGSQVVPSFVGPTASSFAEHPCGGSALLGHGQYRAKSVSRTGRP